MKQLGFLALMLLMVFSSCRKDTDNVTVTTETPTPPVLEAWQPRIENINGDLVGQVINENKEAVAGATVEMNGQTVTTDEYGYFFYNDAQMNSKGQYLTINKEGYFLGSRRFYPNEGAESRIRVELMQMGEGQIATASSQSAVTFNGGASVTFPAGAVANADGSTYNGDYVVHAQWLNPASVEVYDQMPGDLQGVTTGAEEVSLTTLGMVAVELRSMGGEEINIAEGQTATLRLPVPAELLASAPASVPLWSFEEEQGIWVEEGVATLEDGFYIGEVAHFSFWNVDIPGEFVDITLNLVDEDGNPVTDLGVALISNNLGAGWGLTDDNGQVSGAIPAGEDLILEVYGYNYCSDVLYTEDLGSFSDNATLTITVSIPETNTTSISATVTNCDGEPVNSGLALVTIDGITSNYYFSGGILDVQFTSCDENAQSGDVVIVDYATFVQGESVSVTTNTDNALGAYSACGDDFAENNLVTITAGGETYSFAIFNFTVNSQDGSGDTFIEAETQLGGSFELVYFGVGAGDYAQNNLLLNLDLPEGEAVYHPTTQEGFENLVVTEDENGVLTGVFSGELLNAVTNEVEFVEGTFIYEGE